VREGRRRLVAALALTANVGCSSGDPPAEQTRDTTPAVVAEAAASETVWYRKVRALDLTADGEVDSVRLDAVGTRLDSLRLTLHLIVRGTVKHREQWGSSYELAVVDTGGRSRSEREALLRAQLDSVVMSVRVERLDAPGVQLMAEDSAILRGVEPPPTHRISFAYGYETTVRLVWDAPHQRFVRLWSCC
jgi:hypothetical protein